MVEDKKEDTKKSELLRILRDAASDARDLSTRGREIVRQGQFASDLAGTTEEFIKLVPEDPCLPNSVWDDQLSAWRNWQAQAGEVKGAVSSITSLSFATDATTVTTSGMMTAEMVSLLPRYVQEPAQAAQQKFEQLLEQSNLIQELHLEIRRLGLEPSHAGAESTLSPLVQAEQAFKAPSSHDAAPSTILIPIREAINRAFADLLPRRPNQEKAARDREKVRSICTQCCYSQVEREQIERLATEAHDLKDRLSEAKQHSLSRNEVRELFNRGVVFLRAFLRTLDESKMRG